MTSRRLFQLLHPAVWVLANTPLTKSMLLSLALQSANIFALRSLNRNIVNLKVPSSQAVLWFRTALYKQRRSFLFFLSFFLLLLHLFCFIGRGQPAHTASPSLLGREGVGRFTFYIYRRSQGLSCSHRRAVP